MKTPVSSKLTVNSVLKGGSIVVFQGFGVGGQQDALDGGLSGGVSRVEMAEYEPHVARPVRRATREGTFEFPETVS